MKKVLIISSTMPPARDGVSDGIIKIITLLKESISFHVLTSRKYSNSEYVIDFVEKWNYQIFFHIYRLYKKNDYDYILIEYPTPLYLRSISISFISLFIKIFKTKTVLFLHEWGNYSFLGKMRLFPLILFSNIIVVGDENTKKELDNNLKIQSTKISLGSMIGYNIVPNKIRKTSTYEIMYFGFIRSGKGLEWICEQFSNSKILTSKYTLKIVGSLPEICSESDKKLLSYLNSIKNVKILGYCTEEDICQHIFNSRFIVLPFAEGLSERRGSFLAAMKYYGCTITTNPKYQIEGLYDGKNIIYLNSRSLETVIAEYEIKGSEYIYNIKKEASIWYSKYMSDQIIKEKLQNIFHH